MYGDIHVEPNVALGWKLPQFIQLMIAQLSCITLIITILYRTFDGNWPILSHAMSEVLTL